MIGIIPILFLVYFSLIIYEEKLQRVQLIDDHIERVDQSANIAALISGPGRERSTATNMQLKKQAVPEF